MKLYTERHGIRAPQNMTYSVNVDMYSLLFDCCKKYQKNLTHIFTLNCHDDFTNSDYVAFNEKGFSTRIRVKIPSIFQDDFDRICVPTCGDEYDQYALLDLIEFFAQNIKDISEHWNSAKYRNYQTIDCLETSVIFDTFQKEVNEIFAEAGLLYNLTNEKTIERTVSNSPLTPEIEKDFAAVREDGTSKLLNDALSLYRTPNPTARQDSVEKIWDALERLKTYYTEFDKKRSVEKLVSDMSNKNSNFSELFSNEFKSLTDIGNKFRIRHHETDKIDITDDNYYDYLFNRCLSLIAFAVKYLQ